MTEEAETGLGFALLFFFLNKKYKHFVIENK